MNLKIWTVFRNLKSLQNSNSLKLCRKIMKFTFQDWNGFIRLVLSFLNFPQEIQNYRRSKISIENVSFSKFSEQVWNFRSNLNKWSKMVIFDQNLRRWKINYYLLTKFQPFFLENFIKTKPKFDCERREKSQFSKKSKFSSDLRKSKKSF